VAAVKFVKKGVLGGLLLGDVATAGDQMQKSTQFAAWVGGGEKTGERAQTGRVYMVWQNL